MTNLPSPPAPVTPSTTALGRTAEDLACRHLERAGLQCLARNYRCRAGEIDLVMLEPSDGVLVLVEVRSRSRRDYGNAASTIGVVKRRRFSLAARHLLMMRRELRGLRVRFDVVAIDPPAAPGAGTAPELTWLRNAFALT